MTIFGKTEDKLLFWGGLAVAAIYIFPSIMAQGIATGLGTGIKQETQETVSSLKEATKSITDKAKDILDTPAKALSTTEDWISSIFKGTGTTTTTDYSNIVYPPSQSGGAGSLFGIGGQNIYNLMTQRAQMEAAITGGKAAIAEYERSLPLPTVNVGSAITTPITQTTPVRRSHPKASSNIRNYPAPTTATTGSVATQIIIAAQQGRQLI